MRILNKITSVVLFLGAVPIFAPAQQPPIAAADSVTVKGFKIELKQCQKPSSKSISCSLVITNLQADPGLELQLAENAGGSYYVDSEGMHILAGAVSIGSSSQNRCCYSAGTELVTDVPVRATVEFGVGDPKATSLAKLSIRFRSGDEFRAEFRKVPLQ